MTEPLKTTFVSRAAASEYLEDKGFERVLDYDDRYWLSADMTLNAEVVSNDEGQYVSVDYVG